MLAVFFFFFNTTLSPPPEEGRTSTSGEHFQVTNPRFRAGLNHFLWYMKGMTGSSALPKQTDFSLNKRQAIKDQRTALKSPAASLSNTAYSVLHAAVTVQPPMLHFSNQSCFKAHRTGKFTVWKWRHNFKHKPKKQPAAPDSKSNADCSTAAAPGPGDVVCQQNKDAESLQPWHRAHKT